MSESTSTAATAAYMTAAEVMELLSISRASVYRLADRPDVPCLRLGGVLRFPRDRFLAFLRDAEQGSRQKPRRARQIA